MKERRRAFEIENHQAHTSLAGVFYKMTTATKDNDDDDAKRDTLRMKWMRMR
jgi:hypothetical protein